MHSLEPSLARPPLLLAVDKESTWNGVAASAYEKAASLVKQTVHTVAEHPAASIAVAATILGGLYCSRLQIGRMLGLCKTGSLKSGSLFESAGVSVLEQSNLGRGLVRTSEYASGKGLMAEAGLAAPTNELLSGSSKDIVLGSFPHLEIRGLRVGQAAYGIASSDLPLATRGLFTCSALVVQSEKAGMHYLAHLDTGETAGQIVSSLKSFDLSKSRIFLLKGSYGDIAAEKHLLEALSQTPGALQNLRIGAAASDGTSLYGIVSYKNQLYRFDPKMTTAWPLVEAGKYEKGALVNLFANTLSARGLVPK